MPAPSPAERLVIAEIERRRSYVRRSRDVALGRDLERVQRDARAAVRRETSLQTAWRHAAPPDVAARARPRSFRAGVLTLGVADQAGKYLVDRWIKGQGRVALGAALSAVVTRVVIRVGPRS
jgi:hypothetical protein